MSSWTLFSVLSVFSLVIGLSLWTAQMDTPEGAYNKRLAAYHNTVKHIDVNYAYKATQGRSIASAEAPKKIYVSKCYAVVYGVPSDIEKALYDDTHNPCTFEGEAPGKWANSEAGWEMTVGGSLISFTKAATYMHDSKNDRDNMEIDMQGLCGLFKEPIQEYKFLGCETLKLKK